MKRLNNLKWFTLGIIATLLVSISVPALAASITKTATLTYNDIKITLDGKAVTPKDAAGNTVEPFVIDGTTYLPVRAAAGALGIGVDWDGATNTVKLSSALTPAAPSSSGSIVYDKNGIKITYKGFHKSTASSIFAYECDFLIENTTGKDIRFSSVNLSINGFMATPLNGNLDGMTGTIVNGKSSNSALHIYTSTLEDNAITEIKSIEFAVQYTEPNGLNLLGITDVITITP